MTADGPADDLGDITILFRRITEARDDEACEQLWEIYFDRVIRIARSRMQNFSSRDFGEDDIAASAMKSFYVAAENGRLDSINNRDSLWRVLSTITARKASQKNRRFRTGKRNNGQTLTFTDAASQSASESHPTAPDPVAPGSDEAFVGQLLLECQEKLESIPAPRLRQIALMRLEGCDLGEISDATDLSQSSVKDKLRAIRQIWESNESAR